MSAAIKTKEAWDFVQLTFNLDMINWRWKMRAVECKVDYPHSESQASEAGCQPDSDLAEKYFLLNIAFQCINEYWSLCVWVTCIDV